MLPIDIPTITTSRLVLRAFTSEDVDPLYRILGEENVLRYFPVSDPPPRDRVEKMIAGQFKHWEERGYGLWAVQSPSTGELMGRCGLQYVTDAGEVEIDVILGRNFWGAGHATEAARAGLRFAFETVRVERVIGIVHPENTASRRVLEKLGMRFVGARPFFGMDCLLYAIEFSATRRCGVPP